MQECSGPGVERPPEPECVRAHLARLLGSDALSNAPRLRSFLSYVVDRSLAGEGDSVKEYSIGLEVFGRGDAFDPRTDTIVRVQARRLRSKLEEYYNVEGVLDRVVIELPKGGYVPTFRTVAVSEPPDASQTGDVGPERPRAGRSRDLEKLRGLLGREARLALLTSAGRQGRLALELALDGFADDDGAWALRMARGFLAYWDWSQDRRGRLCVDMARSA
jgi:hypothetical protein